MNRYGIHLKVEYKWCNQTIYRSKFDFNIMSVVRSVPLVLCSLLIGVFICESNANDDIDEIEEYRTVETASGKIRGMKKLSILNEIPYYSFKGIRICFINHQKM